MANNNPKVVELGDFWQSTAPFVKKAMEEEQKKYRFRARAANYVLQNEERPDYDLDKYDLKEDAKNRLSSQKEPDFFDEVIVNNSSLEELYKRTDDLIAERKKKHEGKSF